MSTWLAITAIAAELTLLFAIGLRRRGVLGALAMVQAAYWALGYVVRPVILILANPYPQPGDPIADQRLAYPSYAETIGPAITAATVGTGVYVGVLALWLRIWRDRLSSRPKTGWISSAQAAVLIALGWLFRLASLRTESALVQTIALVAALGVGALVLFGDRPLRFVTLAALGASELAWSVATTSKTPLLALVLWIIIRLLADRARVRARVLIPTVAGGLVAFYAIQNVKVAQGNLTDADAYSAGYPLLLRPVLPIVARFDALQAATDAWYAGPRSWIGPLDALRHVADSLIPQSISGSGKVLAGARWGAEVRKISTGADPGANLAEGPFAEGWVIAGWAGVILGAVALSLLLVFVVWLLTHRFRFAMVLGVALTSTPLLFERGLLGFSEGLGKGLQATVAAVVILLLLGLVPASLAPSSVRVRRSEGDEPHKSSARSRALRSNGKARSVPSTRPDD